MIDLDPQGNASTALGVEHHRGVPSTYDVLVDGVPLAEVVQPSPELPGLYVVPATIDLAGAEIELVSVVARESRLRKAIAAHPGIGSTGEDRFDYVFIDCPPSLGLLTLNALVAGAEMLIPIQAEYYALEGLGQLVETVEMVRAHLNQHLEVTTILITMYDGRTKLAAGVAEEVRDHFGTEGPAHRDPAVGARLRGAQLRTERDDLRPGVPGRPQLPRSRPGDRRRGPHQHRDEQRVSQKHPQRRGLGRGLGALIPTHAEEPGGAGRRGHPTRRPPGVTAAPPAPVAGARFAELAVSAITPNPRQPRQVFDEDAMSELVHSIEEVGLLQPVVVRAKPDGGYELVMGERRWRATQQAGLDTIPAIVRETDDDDLLRDALLENLHRSQLNPLEEAAAYEQLLEDFSCTHDELAQRIGRSRPQISNTLRLLKLSPPVQRRVAAGVLSAGHARALLAVDDPEIQDRLAARVTAEGISVRGLEEIVSVGDGARRTSTSRASATRPRPASRSSRTGSATGSRPG